MLAFLVVIGCASHPGSGGSAHKPTSDSDEPAPTFVANSAPSNANPKPPLIIHGSGELTATPKPEDSGATPQSNGNGFQLSFVDTDISAVVGAVLGDGLGLPYVVDSHVKGTMTLHAYSPLNQDDVLSALEGALRVQGVALVNVHGVYHVVPAKDASRNITSLQASRSGWPWLRYLCACRSNTSSASEMEKVLQAVRARMAESCGWMKRGNLLLLAGTGQEITTLLNVIKTFDVDWLAGMSFGLYPLEYVDAKKHSPASIWAEVFTNGKSPIAGVVRFVPMTRLNALMVVTPQPKYLKDVEDWILTGSIWAPPLPVGVSTCTTSRTAKQTISPAPSVVSCRLSYDGGSLNRQTSSSNGSSGSSGLSSFGSNRSSPLGSNSTGVGIGMGGGSSAPLVSGEAP